MPEMNVEDVRQKFDGSVVMYKKAPILFKKVAGDFMCRIFDIMGGEEKQVMFDEKAFAPPAPRVGMVNIAGSVVYVTRIPIRRYKLGLSSENTKLATLMTDYPDMKPDAVKRLLAGLDRRELGEALLNKYPTLTQAVRRTAQFGGCVAFDKQFAVDGDSNLFYKTVRVGRVKEYQPVFDVQYEQLAILLDKAYEKSF